MMQTHTVLFVVLPAICTYPIERISELRKRCCKRVCLLWHRMELQAHGTLHAVECAIEMECVQGRRGAGDHTIPAIAGRGFLQWPKLIAPSTIFYE